jgi:hypothetical protein
MLLIVSIKIMILHTIRLLPTWGVFKLLPLTVAGGGICHSEKLLGAELQRWVVSARSATRASHSLQ